MSEHNGNDEQRNDDVGSLEFLVEETDIFDLDLSKKIEEQMTLLGNQLLKENEYKFTVSFHVELLNDVRIEDVDVKVREWQKNETWQDKIYNLLGFQMDKIDKQLINCGFNFGKMSIQGEYLDAIDIIKVKIEKEESIQNNTTKRKAKSLAKVRSVVPSLPYTQDLVSKLASEKLSKIYLDLKNVIRDEKIMSEVLEIEATDDDNVLFQAFVKHYGGLWLCTSEEKKALLDKLESNVERAIDQHRELRQESNKDES